MFPTEVRGIGAGLAAAVSRVGAGLGTFLLPIGIEKFGVSASMLIACGHCLQRCPGITAVGPRNQRQEPQRNRRRILALAGVNELFPTAGRAG